MTLQERNHPKSGSMLAVDPIRSIEDVQLVQRSLDNQPRNRTIFTLGVNINLRASDLLSLRLSNVDFEQKKIMVRERKTKKIRNIDLSPEVFILLEWYCKLADITQRDQLLFPSRKGGGMMTVSTLNHMVKKWCEDVGLRGHYGSHTLRKTWAFVQYSILGTDLALISDGLNHASMKTTFAYIGINSDAKKAMYMKYIGG
jgi:integrase